MTFAGHRAPSASGALRGTGTSVTSGLRKGVSAAAAGLRKYGSALSIVEALPALMLPQIVLDLAARRIVGESCVGELRKQPLPRM
jgi:hypothetical protein